MLYSSYMPNEQESGFEMLARLIKEEGEDVRGEINELRNEVREGFAAVNNRLDAIIQMQLDEHASRIKKLEMAVFSQ